MTVLVSPSQAAMPSYKKWLADTRAAMYGSRAFVDARPAAPGEQLAINLDIDNTALSTKYRPGRATPVVLRFAQYAHSRGIKVFFNTGRQSGLTNVAAQLRRVGYPVDAICGRAYGESLTSSKQRCRQQFTTGGFTIIANVGNRSTDFVGTNYERAFKLPSYGNRLG
jgi:predicted secreted acid phosphatase